MSPSVRISPSRTIAVHFEPGGDGWWVASAPGVPGAYSQGRGRTEAHAMLLDAMAGAAQVGLGPVCNHAITDAEREIVERALRERFGGSGDKENPAQLAGILRTLWAKVRPCRGPHDAFAVRQEIARRCRWELDVRAREAARDHAVVRAWCASNPIGSEVT